MFGKARSSASSEEVEQKIQQALKSALQNVEDITQNVVQLPALLQQIDRELAKEDYQADKVAALIEQDPVIAARVLKLANAPAYKPAGSDIVDLQQAVAYIGGKLIQQFVITAAIRQMSDTPPIYFKMFGRQIWRHSQQTALIARALAHDAGVDAAAAYLTGLIHDIGKIAIFRILVDVLRSSHPDMTPSSSLFRQALTSSSLKLSFGIAQSWQLPEEISLALRDQYLSPMMAETPALSRVLYQANLYSELIMLLDKSMIDTDMCAAICHSRQLDIDFIMRFREQNSAE
jgi:HD-like signal output (HDOD) protein